MYSDIFWNSQRPNRGQHLSFSGTFIEHILLPKIDDCSIPRFLAQTRLPDGGQALAQTDLHGQSSKGAACKVLQPSQLIPGKSRYDRSLFLLGHSRPLIWQHISHGLKISQAKSRAVTTKNCLAAN